MNPIILFKDEIYSRWLIEMLDDVADLTIPRGMEQSRVSEDLRLAISYAKSGDIEFMRQIENLLINIEMNISRFLRIEELQSIN